MIGAIGAKDPFNHRQQRCELVPAASPATPDPAGDVAAGDQSLRVLRPSTRSRSGSAANWSWAHLRKPRGGSYLAALYPSASAATSSCRCLDSLRRFVTPQHRSAARALQAGKSCENPWSLGLRVRPIPHLVLGLRRRVLVLLPAFGYACLQVTDRALYSVFNPRSPVDSKLCLNAGRVPAMTTKVLDSYGCHPCASRRRGPRCNPAGSRRKVGSDE